MPLQPSRSFWIQLSFSDSFDSVAVCSKFRAGEVLDVDVSKPDFLLATLGNYSTVKIAWEGMDDQTPASHGDLVRKLTMLRKAIRSQVAPDAVIWNATMPDTITGDTQRKL